jgi:predicted nucleic acid-binding protein
MGAMRHALEHGIHVQDATYIETSRRRGIPLVSADATQLRAARAAGVVATAVGEVPNRDT